MKTKYIKFIGVIILLLSFFSSNIYAEVAYRGNYNEPRKGRGIMGAKVVNLNDEIRLNQIVDSVQIASRESFILRTLERVNVLELKVQNTETRYEIKARKLAFLGEIRDILELKLYYIQNLNYNYSTYYNYSNNYSNNNSINFTSTQTSNSTLNTTVVSTQSGKGYYVVLSSSALAPSSAQIKSGVDAYGNYVSIKGNIALSTGANQLYISGLNQNISYVLYFTTEDNYGRLNTNVFRLTFQTSNVGTSSTQNLSLVLSSITSSTINGIINTNVAGRGYYVILPYSANVPSYSQIRAGTDSYGYATLYKGNLYLNSGSNQFSVIGLAQNTSYKIYLIEEDYSGNTLYNTLTLAFNTNSTYGNSTNYNSINFISTQTTTSSLTTTVVSTQSGRGYYVILSSSSLAPNYNQIKNGVDGYGNYASINGSLALSVGNNQLYVSGLNANNNYVLYFISEDSYSGINTNVFKLPFLTSYTGSNTSQNLSLVLSSITSSTINGTINTNVSGRGYYVILPYSANVPSYSQIRAGTDSYGYTTLHKGNLYLNSGSNQFSFIGLVPNTSYKIYLIEEDYSGNILYSTIILPFQTTNTYTPSTITPTQNISVSLNTITSSTINGIVNTNVAGRGYYVILPSSAPSPNSGQIKSGLDSYSNNTSLAGNIYLYTGNNQLNISGLNSNTSYTLYFTFVDSNRNLLPNPVVIPFFTY
ncbi:MAG: hypothetical protein PHZ26_05300 [Candidatus Gracilibacteria bacterium]|nr:hypothetical protein [Candidatus Gracilibacteria bacterium]MDD2909132.1 hypothetical protein [Candidatus Gracilibacteria bacterium]